MKSIYVSWLFQLVAALLVMLASQAPFVGTPYEALLQGVAIFVGVLATFLLSLGYITLARKLRKLLGE